MLRRLIADWWLRYRVWRLERRVRRRHPDAIIVTASTERKLIFNEPRPVEEWDTDAYMEYLMDKHHGDGPGYI